MWLSTLKWFGLTTLTFFGSKASRHIFWEFSNLYFLKMTWSTMVSWNMLLQFFWVLVRDWTTICWEFVDESTLSFMAIFVVVSTVICFVHRREKSPVSIFLWALRDPVHMLHPLLPKLSERSFLVILPSIDTTRRTNGSIFSVCLIYRWNGPCNLWSLFCSWCFVLLHCKL